MYTNALNYYPLCDGQAYPLDYVPFADLVDAPHGRASAGLALRTVAVLYSHFEWFLYVRQYDMIPPPFLCIPNEQYYAWATLFCVPTFLGCWLLASGAMQLVSRALGGRGRFEDLASAVAWTIGVATMFTLVPDLTTITLGVYKSWWATSRVSLLTISLYVVAFVVLYTAALRAVHGLGRASAILVGLGGVVVCQGVFFLFIR